MIHYDRLLRLGRFRLSFVVKGDTVRWYGGAIGVETRRFRAWKERIRGAAAAKKKALTWSTIKECAFVVASGMIFGHIIRLYVG